MAAQRAVRLGGCVFGGLLLRARMATVSRTPHVMHPGGRDVQPHRVAADFAAAEQPVQGLADATQPLPFRPAAHHPRRGRTAMYSKKESVPPGASSSRHAARIRSTSASAKLFSGSPETIKW